MNLQKYNSLIYEISARSKKTKTSQIKTTNHIIAKTITNLGLIISEGVEPEAAFGVIEETKALICLWD
jgi:hypothetical protein